MSETFAAAARVTAVLAEAWSRPERELAYLPRTRRREAELLERRRFAVEGAVKGLALKVVQSLDDAVIAELGATLPGWLAEHDIADLADRLLPVIRMAERQLAAVPRARRRSRGG